MSNLMLLLNIVSSLSTAPASQTIPFDRVLENVSESEARFFADNEIDGWGDYADYLSSLSYFSTSGNGDDSESVSDSITDIKIELERKYPDYSWVRDDESCALTSDVSGHIPIEMQSTDFPKEDILEAIQVADVGNITSYGGCGPIAMMGIMDYFARYLGYTEIIEDPTSSEQRIALAAEILSRVAIFPAFSTESTFVLPSDYIDGFDRIMFFHDLLDIINANSYFTLIGGEKSYFWNKVVENIDQGLPVTMCAWGTVGSGEFSNHYTNIYGYETWTGIPNNGGEKITKEFVKARLNWGRNLEYYCDADILNYSGIGIIHYNINYENSYSFYDHDFAEYFVNEVGGGQYFFDPIVTDVYLPSGMVFETERLRASFIENQYLVLSPKRSGAGVAYIDIVFTHKIPKLSFTASMWSEMEDALNERFIIQYYENNKWIDHVEIDPSDLSVLKDYPDNFTVLFPKDTTWIRFYSTHSNPSGSRNKGRICLDNFVAEYNS